MTEDPKPCVRFKVPVGGSVALMTAAQLEAVLCILYECDMLYEHWVGSGQGTDGKNYLTQVRPFNLDTVNATPIMGAQIETLRLATKLFDANKD